MFVYKQFHEWHDTCYAPSGSIGTGSAPLEIHVPRLLNLLKDKLDLLPPHNRRLFEDLFAIHDKEMETYCSTMWKAHAEVVRNQSNLRDSFGDMIDEAIRAFHADEVEQEPVYEAAQETEDQEHSCRGRTVQYIFMFICLTV